MNEKTISRRSLLKLASASTVTAAAVLPSAVRAAQTDQWDETYEIIVVGAGGAGMAAAVKAAQKGAKHVVVLEKLNFPGGNTLISQGFINAADPVRQPKQGIKDSWQHHAEVRTGMGVEEIIREKPFEGDVLGVVAKNAKGEIKRIRATRGVVLAAGGFSANKYLRELHDPRVAGLGTDNLPGATGEVAMAAVRVGGYLVGMDFIQSTPGAPAGKKMKLLLNFNVNGSIYVDKRGARIVNEGARRDVIRDAVLGTPERYAYTVCDNENFTSYDEVNRAAIMKGIEAGEAWTAPTIRELAQKMGVDPDGLEKTIKRYNDVYVKNQKDEDFGKTAVNLTKRIDQGPFWACYTGMTVHHTMGGLNTNVKAQVLDWTGAVIPRLYAAGEITGGIHGTNRVGGNAVLDCFVFGQIAGENASQETIAA